jgi:hypothetical protein
MPNTTEEIVQYATEVQSVVLSLYDLSIRAQRLVDKAASNGLDLEVAAIAARPDLILTDIQAAYTNVVKDIVNFVQNNAVGRSDRRTTIWKIAKRQSV